MVFQNRHFKNRLSLILRRRDGEPEMKVIHHLDPTEIGYVDWYVHFMYCWWLMFLNILFRTFTFFLKICFSCSKHYIFSLFTQPLGPGARYGCDHVQCIWVLVSSAPSYIWRDTIFICHDHLNKQGFMTSYQISGCSLVRQCQARRADWPIHDIFFWANRNFYPVFTRKSGHCLQSKAIFILILSNMSPILLWLHFSIVCLCRTLFFPWVLCPTELCLLFIVFVRLTDCNYPLGQAGCGVN